MVNSTTKKQSKHITNMLDRLKVIKQTVDTSGGHTKDSLAKLHKGSSYIYPILVANKILLDTQDGLIWNTKIPITTALAVKIAEKVHYANSEARNRYQLRKVKGLVNVRQAPIEKQSAQTITTTVSKKRKPVIKSVNKSKEASVISLFWGLIKFEIK